jgi:DNA-binding MarR family transcriptional regulator
MAGQARKGRSAPNQPAPHLARAIETARESLETLLSLLDSRVGTDAKNASSDTLGVARRLYRERRVRDSLLGSELFGEPGWDILLELYAARMESRRLATTDVCMASGVPPTTALRWLVKLEEAKLVQRSHASSDARLTLVDLTDEGVSRMAELLRRLARS